jgi:ketosteroid isomerase-like protein
VVRNDLVEMERKYWEAGLAGDLDFYMRGMAPESLNVFPEGIMDKDQMLEMMQGTGRLVSYDLGEPTVMEINRDVGLITYRARFEDEDEQGKRTSYDVYSTSVYVRRQGQWQLAFSQMTPVQSSA